MNEGEGIIIVVLFLGFLGFLVWMQKQQPPSAVSLSPQPTVYISLKELEEARRFRESR